MKTHKEMVNNVLLRLREREVASVNENSYSKLISIFVQDAKELVEAAWNWSVLRQTLTAVTQSGVFNYVLTDSGNNVNILDVVNLTSDSFLQYKDPHWFTNAFLNTTPATGNPAYYVFNGVSVGGDTQVDLYPIPDAAYTIYFNVVMRSQPLVNDADTLRIPHLPVQALAYAMALEERGEDGGMSAVSAKALASNYLSDAIALDADKHPEELIWEAC
jgi:hypothetical protein|tara:strand:- start:8337 stop:8987 length:651 start_codon:yes stop_codon:yes gene_type:complete